MNNPLLDSVPAIDQIPAIRTMLEVVCQTTGMGFAAVARVTEDRWIACSVLDQISFGLKAGGELKLETTICDEIRQNPQIVVIDHVAEDAHYAQHHTPKMYGFQSYISMPIILTDSSFFGTLCAIDPNPAKLNTPQIINTFKLFAELISFHINAMEKLAASESNLLEERKSAELRDQFIAVLGHDLRNPLGAISSGATVLKRMPLDERSTKVVNIIHDCVTRMTGLIENVLDFARGRLGGGLTLNYSDGHDLQEILTQVVTELQTSHPQRQVQVAFQLTEPVTCDINRIAQLFSNLLGNALTYGDPTAPVRVEAKTQQGEFQLSVANAGSAIPPAKLAQLFEPFIRGESKDKQEGLGLGLYIVAEIARAHMGTITAQSTNQETRFTFTMPVCAVQQQMAA